MMIDIGRSAVALLSLLMCTSLDADAQVSPRPQEGRASRPQPTALLTRDAEVSQPNTPSLLVPGKRHHPLIRPWACARARAKAFDAAKVDPEILVFSCHTNPDMVIPAPENVDPDMIQPTPPDSLPFRFPDRYHK